MVEMPVKITCAFSSLEWTCTAFWNSHSVHQESLGSVTGGLGAPRFHPQAALPWRLQKWLQPTKLGDSFSPDRAARRQERHGGPPWALRSAGDPDTRGLKVPHHLLLPPGAKGASHPQLCLREPPPPRLPPFLPSSAPHPSTQEGACKPRFAGERLSGYFSRGISQNRQGSQPAPGGLSRLRRYLPPAAVLPAYLTFTLTQTQRSCRAWRAGLRGDSAS